MVTPEFRRRIHATEDQHERTIVPMFTASQIAFQIFNILQGQFYLFATI